MARTSSTPTAATFGGPGDDSITDVTGCCTPGDDRLFGEGGDDRLYGGDGTDLCDGGKGQGDSLYPDHGCETIRRVERGVP